MQIIAPALLEFGRHQSAKADANYRRPVGNFEIAETFKGSLCGDLWVKFRQILGEGDDQGGEVSLAGRLGPLPGLV